MGTMIAARYLGPDRIEPVEVAVPSIGHDEALIQVEACGFCGSDLGIVAGVHPRARPPLTIGHEFCGRVAEIHSDSSPIRLGDRVTSYPLISCGTCFACRHGQAHVCRQLRLYGFDADGGMAQFVKLPVDSLIALSPNMAAEIGALVEPLAVAVHGAARVPLEEARTVAVMGAGPIGLLTALVLRRRGVENILISDVLATRLERAARLGLTAIHANEGFLEQVLERTNGDGADIVFECVGAAGTAQQMTSLARCRGTIVNLGVFKRLTPVDLQAVNFKEISIVGSRVYTRQDFEDAVAMGAALPLEGLVTHSFPLTQVAEAFDRFRAAEGACKVIMKPSEVSRGSILA
jgi:2-desacetyl-2-hydroxyethyl bacteriochlorophyllide A dehydrogenase